ncbi:helicase-exonuclease AddAB subunit AddB [Bacillus songklensis]|uniref:ATP-dependent helicase/deoxyribonuclease subunit B n=1 Tax=Bacillus songklensis TaxID=1069116 RepID=A0ABV8B068_9BACI
MALQFLLGRSGSGKTEHCLNAIRQTLQHEPLGAPIIYIVPEQMTFQSEYALIQTPGLNGMMRAQVFSLTRLAWRILQEVGGMSRHHVDSTGISMMLRKIIEKRKQELKIFANASEKTGFIENLERMLTEFKRYCLNADALENKQEELLHDSQKVLGDKFHDLQLIYDELEKQLLHKYIDSEDYLRLLAEKVPHSSYLENASIYIDGFHSFTPQELEVITQLMKTCPSVTIALTVDPGYEHRLPHEMDLFHMTAQTYQTICQLAHDQQVEMKEPITLTKAVRFEEAPGLYHLEKYFDDRPTAPFEQPVRDIKLMSAVNRRAEVEGAAREIRELVRQEGYRYRDIALVVRNGHDYGDLIDTIFQDYEIPYFQDRKRAMVHHPLIEFIRASLEVANGVWRYEPIFRCVKTDLLFPFDANASLLREEMDRLENYVLSYGIQGMKWTMEENWKYRRYRSLEDMDIPQTDEEREFEEKINELRQLIVRPLKQLQDSLKKAKSGREMCEALYSYLVMLDIPKKMEKWRDESEKQGDLDSSRGHDQAWKAVIELFDQFVEMMGDEKISVDLFTSVMETGLDTMQFALVPPAIDQVLVASFERSRFSNIKATFVLGVNDGVIPAKPQEDGILSDQEREYLWQSGFKLAPSSKQQLFDEQFYIYSAFVSPSKRLYISYPLANEEGKTLLPSVVVNRLKDMFPLIEEQLLMQEPAELAPEEQLQYVSNPLMTLTYLAGQLQSWKKQYPVDDIWWDAYNFYADDEEWNTYSRRVLSSLFYRNEAKSLTKETSISLYGKHIQASVSRMEKFQACPFSHFVSHGLRLKERKVFRLEAPDIGELFHAALKMMAEELRANQRDWRHLTNSECKQLSHHVVDELAPKLQNEILLSSNRHHYLKHKLQQIIERASLVLSDHARASGFAPIGLELAFGPDQPLPAMQFTLPNGSTMELAGRIDRVDKAESSKGVLLRIVDYKSSDKALNLVEVYYGLALQMLAYLDVVITYAEKLLGNGQSALPAGILYFHVHNPMINSSKALSLDEIEEEIFKRFKMKGLLLGDEEAVRLMDQTIETGHSRIVSAGLKKGGGFYSNSSVADEQQFNDLRKHIRSQFTDIGTRITDGIIDISPYKLKDKTPCEFCAFRSVCQFDQSMEEHDYRHLKSERPELILEKLRKGETEHE